LERELAAAARRLKEAKESSGASSDSKLLPERGLHHTTAVRCLLAKQPTLGKGKKRKAFGGDKSVEYVMTFRYAGSIATGGGGTAGTVMPFDVSGAADFSSAAALFSECRAMSATVELCNQQVSGGNNARLTIGFNPSNSSSTPSAEGDVMQLQPVRFMSASTTVPIRIHANLAKSLNWALCSSPIPGPYAGLYGSFDSWVAGTNSLGVANYFVEVVVAFRGRK
jgi:hypothetical protein